MWRNARGVFRTCSDFVRTPSTLCALCRLQSHPYESTLTRLNSVRFARKFLRAFLGISFVFSCGTPLAFFRTYFFRFCACLSVLLYSVLLRRLLYSEAFSSLIIRGVFRASFLFVLFFVIAFFPIFDFGLFPKAVFAAYNAINTIL